MEDVFVAIYPLSMGNPSNKFRVARKVNWQKFLDKETDDYQFTEFDNLAGALASRDKLNHDAAKKAKVVVEDEATEAA